MDSCFVIGCNESPSVLINIQFYNKSEIDLLVCDKHQKEISESKDNKITVKEL